MKAYLALEDGFVLEGESFTGEGEALGEVVFNTSMTGYQEILTDPSYKGQIVTMTYPLIGNYGVNFEDRESADIRVEGFVIREYPPRVSNWRARGDLAEYLMNAGVLGVEGIDTRALTKHTRSVGALRGVLSTNVSDPAALVEQARRWPGLVGVDMVRQVSSRHAYAWPDLVPAASWKGTGRFRVVVYDYGTKYNILRSLEKRNCEVVVLPPEGHGGLLDELAPDGIVLSNGPGDPEGIPYAVEEVRRLLGIYPIFGICMGHQVLGLALGGRTYKLKFGHRGGNQPVMNLETRTVEITSQNHGFCVDPESLEPSEVEATHVNLNDGTLEGFRHRKLPVFSVQYHPEASPGPHDASYLFDRFVDLMETRKDRRHA